MEEEERNETGKGEWREKVEQESEVQKKEEEVRYRGIENRGNQQGGKIKREE